MDFTKAIMAKHAKEVEEYDKLILSRVNDPLWIKANNLYNRDGFVSDNISVVMPFKLNNAAIIFAEIKTRFTARGWRVLIGTPIHGTDIEITLGK